MSYTGGVILGIFAVGTLVLALVQISQYVRRHSIITPRQFALRMVMAGLLLAVIAGYYVGLGVRWRGPMAELIYWAIYGPVSMIAVFVVVVLGFRDARTLEQLRHQHRAQLFRHLADLEESPKEPKDSGN